MLSYQSRTINKIIKIYKTERIITLDCQIAIKLEIINYNLNCPIIALKLPSTPTKLQTISKVSSQSIS